MGVDARSGTHVLVKNAIPQKACFKDVGLCDVSHTAWKSGWTKNLLLPLYLYSTIDLSFTFQFQSSHF